MLYREETVKKDAKIFSPDHFLNYQQRNARFVHWQISSKR
jgi:hypothetical protein